jgi:hypothetical protein
MQSGRNRIMIWMVISLAILGVVLFASFGDQNGIKIGGKSLSDLFNGDSGTIFTVIFVVIVMALTMFPFFRIIFPAKIKNGITTEAKVLKVWDTGVTINNNPQLGLLLEYSQLGSSVIQAQAKTVVSRIQAALVQPGITAEVLYDPNKPTRVQLKTLHVAEAAQASTASIANSTDPSNSMDPSDRLEELNDMHNKKLITDEEFQQKREEILKNL